MCAVWQRLLGRPVSESGRLRHGDGGHEGRDRRRRSFVLPILPGDAVVQVTAVHASSVQVQLTSPLSPLYGGKTTRRHAPRGGHDAKRI
jgi:hypothetical protein